ncbi:AGE family epimerase/isomerase [Brevundimonas vesicularis]|uniref:AGE family epimerase/isomerase n=1 Tax=Brevundimonas vesicularis TaxID=41276 RepID=UPI0022EC42B6|nr:AGE family epimerase/isomerase [Brevundimonas vesicularis]WBT06419.1 AGE family epimerase/isomerase [Brevundimonas vesicularis]
MTTLSAARTRVSNWLFDHALPLWAERGVDAQGRFFEQLDFHGRPVTGLRRRTRVQARQVYVFCEAAALGWEQGRAVARAGLDQLISSGRRDDGLWVAATDDDLVAVDDAPDLYDLAFVLFALAAAHRVLDDARARPLALETLAAIDRLMASPHGGWEEALPPRLPRRQNPHMHMLEAMLAWQAIAPDPAFEAAARASLDLCKHRFLIDGAIREYFTEDWSADPATGHVIEPGHLEEWAWLLQQAGGGSDLAAALHLRAAEQGYRDGFATREIGPTGEVLDGGRRLWAQTEAIRTGLSFGDAGVSRLIAAVFDTHLATAVSGLWVDSYDAQGRSHDTAAPASSLYHLMSAFSELLRSDA